MTVDLSFLSLALVALLPVAPCLVLFKFEATASNRVMSVKNICWGLGKNNEKSFYNHAHRVSCIFAYCFI